MRIPEHKIDEILNSANIVDVVSGYVQLKKRGKNFIGLCPFHQEKTPSFTVSEEKQIYHCFGCHAGGNVFKFLMEYNNVSFVESVQEIAGQLGIQLEAEEGYNTNLSEQEKLYELNVLAAKFFHDALTKSEEGEIAREYFKNRKIKDQTHKIFGLGYAKQGWDNFVRHAQENHADLELAKSIGLVDQKNGGNYYDKLRGRIIFPIFSPNGRVIAFGGRILENNDNVAKYLNSPESTIYFKRKSLYGLFHSKDDIRSLDKAILVEGYMDLISLYQNGVKNVVASSGTALTDEQVQLLSRYTKNVVVLFDSDAAGQKAAMRSIETLLKRDFDVRLLTLPDGEDPDSFVIKFGKEKFNEELLKAQNFLEYQTSRFQKEGKLDDPNTTAEAIRELVKTSALVKDELKRNILLRSIAQKFNLRQKLIEDEADKFFKATSRETNIEESRRQRKAVEQNRKFYENPREKELIKLLFQDDSELIGFIFDHILPEDFINKSYREIAEKVHDEFVNNNISKPASLIEKLENEELKNIVLNLSFSDIEISKKWEEANQQPDTKNIIKKIAEDSIKSYMVTKIDEQIKHNINTISNLDNPEEQIELMKLVEELKKDKITIINQPPYFEY